MASLDERRRRVANGSRRKRDRDAVGARESERLQREAEKRDLERESREERLRPKVEETSPATEAWGASAELLAASIPPSTFALWIEPMRCIGEAAGALCLEAPDPILAWSERRYGKLIGEAVRKATAYKGAFLFLAAPAADDNDEDGLL